MEPSNIALLYEQGNVSVVHVLICVDQLLPFQKLHCEFFILSTIPDKYEIYIVEHSG